MTGSRWPLSGDANVRHRSLGGLAVSEAGGDRVDPVPLLFLHGIGSARWAFDAQFAHFGPLRWCVAADAPGYADSDDDPAIDGLGGYVERWTGLLDDLGAAQADVVGVSWGGVMAARLAAEHPDRIRTLVIADSSRGSGVTPEKAAGMRRRLDYLERDGIESFSAARATRLVSPNASPELVARVAETMTAAVRLPGYAQAVESMAGTDNTSALAAITVPTLVLVGSVDVVTPPEEAAILAQLVPGSRLVEIDGAGHLANQEAPDRFNEAVAEFLVDHI